MDFLGTLVFIPGLGVYSGEVGVCSRDAGVYSGDVSVCSGDLDFSSEAFCGYSVDEHSSRTGVILNNRFLNFPDGLRLIFYLLKGFEFWAFFWTF